MDDLIARLEKATGPDRNLDHHIHYETAIVKSDKWTAETWVYAATREQWATPYLTASIDAALTLVEAGSAWAVSHSPDSDPEGYPKPFRATVMPPLAYSGRRDATDWHAHPAIALCIAALKARKLVTAGDPSGEKS